jgi:hypothetical protein
MKMTLVEQMPRTAKERSALRIPSLGYLPHIRCFIFFISGDSILRIPMCVTVRLLFDTGLLSLDQRILYGVVLAHSAHVSFPLGTRQRIT